MAFDTNGTKLANLFNPQVVAGLVEKKLTDAIKFSPLARVDTTLVGRPGNTVTLPSFAYIGDATVVAEGADIPISQLTETPVTTTIHKVAKGVQISDEAVLSGYGDPASEAVDQIILSIASKVDGEMLTTLSGIGTAMTHTITSAFDADAVSDALVKFGEDIDGDKVLLVSPARYNTLRKSDDWIPNTEIGADIIIKGAVGMIHGCQIVVSNKLTAASKEASYIVKPGALALYLKRETLVETDRDIINKSTVMTADKHFVTYLYDASKAVKIVSST